MAEKTYHHGDLRRALIDASIALIGESGTEAFTLREVARRADVSHTAPYRHFQDKSDLLAAVAEQGFTNLHRAVTGAIATVRRPLERLRRSGLAYINFALENTAHFRVMFGARLDPGRHPGARAAAETAFAALVAVIGECQESGDVARGDTRKKASIAWSLVHGIAHLAIGHQLLLKTPEDVTRFATAANDALIEGLRHGR